VSGAKLCIPGAARLRAGQSQTFELELGAERVQGFVLRHAAGLFAYRNRCPHQPFDLDLGDGRFYAEDIDRIYCKNHGALFRVADGYCDHGLCMGESLERFALSIDGDDVWVTLNRSS